MNWIDVDKLARPAVIMALLVSGFQLFSVNKLAADTDKSTASELEQSLRHNPENPKLLYNLGLSLAEDKNWGKAKLSMESAFQKWPQNSRIREGLRQLNEVLKKETGRSKIDAESYRSMVYYYLSYLSPKYWAIGGFAGLWLLFFAVGLRRFSRFRRTAAALSLIASLLTLLSFSSYAYLHHIHLPERSVVLESTSPRDGPSEYANILESDLAAGMTVTVEVKRDEWSRIKTPDGKKGWVDNEYIESIGSVDPIISKIEKTQS